MMENKNSLKQEKKKTLRRIKEASAICKKYPKAEWQEIYHTLFLLEQPPLERLRLAIQRSGKFPV